MNISEVIKNITEIQNPNWVADLTDVEIEKIESNFWLVWMKLKSISNMEIIEPLLKISEFLSIREMKDGKMKVKMKGVEFRHFYNICIGLIPKKKYKFIYPKKKKNNNRDYEFLKLLSTEFKESILNCEDYYDTFEELGILENEKVQLFKKYGVDYSPKSSDIIEIVSINSIIEHPKKTNIGIKSNSKEYLYLLEKIKKFGLLEPIIVEKGTNYIVNGYIAYECCKELGIQKVQVIKKVFQNNVLEIINFKLGNNTILPEQVRNYRELNQKIKNLGYKERKKQMGSLSLRDYLFKQTGISQTQISRLAYIENTDSEKYNEVLEGTISINQCYLELKGLKNTAAK